MMRGHIFRLLILWGLVCGQAVMAEPDAGKFHEGSQYQRIVPPLPVTGQRDRVEVVEMFFYACPHCRELEPKMKHWLENKPQVDFRRVPAILGPNWAEQARAYYIARELGRLEELHQALFREIHEEGRQIYNQYAVVEFFVRHGVPREKVLELYYSDPVLKALNEARVKTVKSGLRGVPAVIVNGTYKTAPYFVHNQEEMLEVLDSLVEKERQKKRVAENVSQ
ncbi:MAG TPA: thiol:disulfide interchange protein DsbA/DsbL [Gammaproteobacteria bacterium]|nr:thiol:disulfide interchange protein DsbA/DsbL [Gammaproteobacteria bacterium]